MISGWIEQLHRPQRHKSSWRLRQRRRSGGVSSTRFRIFDVIPLSTKASPPAAASVDVVSVRRSSVFPDAVDIQFQPQLFGGVRRRRQCRRRHTTTGNDTDVFTPGCHRRRFVGFGRRFAVSAELHGGSFYTCRFRFVLLLARQRHPVADRRQQCRPRCRPCTFRRPEKYCTSGFV